MIVIHCSSNTKYSYNRKYVDAHIEPESLWNIIKNEIKKLQNNNDLSYESFISSLLHLDNFDQFDTKNNLEYSVYILYFYNQIVFEANYIGRDYKDHTLYKDIYLITDKEGNCVDDFIKRGVESRLKLINNAVTNIRNRLYIRSTTNAYHQTGCYEYDFSDICLIKEQAEKIVQNCNKQLEALSDKYTNL